MLNMEADKSFNDDISTEPEYFQYTDTDVYQNEIAELYSYTELSEFRQNFRSYAIEIHQLKATTKWLSLEENVQESFIMAMIDRLEVSDQMERMRAARCILYLAQGCWMEAKTIEEQQQCTCKNVLVLYKHGAFSAFIDLLNMELEKSAKTEDTDIDSDEVHVTMNDSTSLRLVMNVLYTLIETIRAEHDKVNPEFVNIATELISELSNPLADGELFQIKLLNMMVKYCNGTSPYFPIKKIMLLLWKSTLLALGGMQRLKDLKNALRLKADLPPIKNDTLDVIKNMRATILADEDIHVSRKLLLTGKRVKTAFFDNKEDASAFLKRQEMSANPKQVKAVQREMKTKETNSATNESASVSPKCMARNDAIAINPNLNSSYNKSNGSALLFEPKVRPSDIKNFLQHARQKYFGFSLENDNQTVIGLPAPIHESVQALRRHLYVSLGELQINAELQQSKKAIFTEEQSEISAAEQLYQAMLPNMWNYINDLLRVQAAASPTAKLTGGNINSRIITDMLPKNPSQTTIFSTTMKSDVLRHKEIIVKSVSAFLLLCLKHFKLNHIYHSEYVCQLMIQASFIKLVLQLFTPSFNEYTQTITSVPSQEFPACVIVQDNERNLFNTDANIDPPKPTYSWRNMFACVNFLRLLNKVVKWKPSRILNMVYLKSVNMLKESLKVQQPLIQVYALKLLKMQARYLGRNWRRHNLKVLTAIYTKVRPRFIDDWAYGCNTVGDFWCAQEDEMEAFSHVRNYHLQRYPQIKFQGYLPSNFKESAILQLSTDEQKLEFKHWKIDSFPESCACNKSSEGVNTFSEISKNIKPTYEECIKTLPLMEPIKSFKEVNEVNEDLPEGFKKHYETWLNNQVFNSNFDWDSI